MSRRAILIIWVVMAALLVVSSAVFYDQLLGGIVTVAEAVDSGTHAPEVEESTTAAVLSLLASLATLIGFVSTTILAWRRESREVEKAQLDLVQQAYEIEKLRRELDGLLAENDREDRGGREDA